MTGSVSVTSKGLRAVAAFARDRGVDPLPIVEAAGLDASVLADSDRRITREQWSAVWHDVADALDDPALALHVATWLPFGTFDVMDYLAITADTVGHALERVAAYFRLIHDRTEVEIVRVGDERVVRHRLIDDTCDASRFSAEFAFACYVVRFRRATGTDWTPHAIRFSHSGPDDPSVYEALFGCPVRFDEPENECVLDDALLDTPLKRADPLLNEVLQRHAEQLMEQLPDSSRLSDVVRQQVHEAMSAGDPSIENVARRLGMSTRTLQRRLRDESVTYNELVDEMRRDMATDLLRDPSMAISEVAFLLGFSDPSAFHRAFRRWTGTTPGEFRRELIAS